MSDIQLRQKVGAGLSGSIELKWRLSFVHLSCQGNGSLDLVGDLGVREEAAAQLCPFNSLCFTRIRKNFFLLLVK